MRILEILTAGPYNAAFAVGILASILLALRSGRVDGHPRLPWAVLVCAAVAAGLIGSKLIFFDLEPIAYGEKTILGGLVLGAAAAVLVAGLLGLGVRRSLDSLAIPALAGMAVGRVGCFLAECCTGTATSLPWGVRNSSDPHPVHPVQLYEAGADLLLLAAIARSTSGRPPGIRAGSTVAAYAGIRFLSEFVRAGRTMHAGLNSVQWILLVVGAGVAIWTFWTLRTTRGTALVGAVAPGRDPVVDQRAFAAALLLGVLLVAVPFTWDAWVTPLETVTLLLIAAGIVTYAAVSKWPLVRNHRLAPSLMSVVPFSTLLMMQAPASDSTIQREIVVGATVVRGGYDRIVARLPSDLCAGAFTPTIADRDIGAEILTLGVRRRFRSGRRVTTEAQLVTGRDLVQGVAGPLPPEVPVEDVRTLAAGARITIEEPNTLVRIDAIAGRMSRDGAPSNLPSVSVLLRLGADRGWFTEFQLTEAPLFSTVGDFSYGALGYAFATEGVRASLGLGHGARIGVHVPIGSLEFDFAHLNRTGGTGAVAGGSGWSLGVRRSFPVR